MVDHNASHPQIIQLFFFGEVAQLSSDGLLEDAEALHIDVVVHVCFDLLVKEVEPVEGAGRPLRHLIEAEEPVAHVPRLLWLGEV